MTPVEQAVVDAVDEASLLAVLADLVAAPSVATDGDSPGEAQAQRRAAAHLREAGVEVELWTIDVPALSGQRGFSAEVERLDPVGVLGTTGAGDGPVLLVDAHVDVVPAGIEADWTTPPFAMTPLTDADGRRRVAGRGTCDTKGGLAAAIAAAAAIRDAGVELAGRLLIGPVVGEEDGGSGTLALLHHLRGGGRRVDGCLVIEPTQLAVVPATAGALSWRITVRGRSAHGCLREEGVSAIERFRVVHDVVMRLEQDRNGPDGPLAGTGGLFGWLDRPLAICGGRIAGGDWPSSEADWLTWEGRYGVAPGEDLAEARTALEDAVARACADDPWLADHPAVVEWWGGQFLPSSTPVDAPVVTALAGAVADLGGDPTPRGMPYGCDAGLTAGVAGIPTAVFGPGDIRDAHRPDESVAVDELVAAARAIALTALRTCGVRTGAVTPAPASPTR